ncbi:MAG: asparagine synthase (glutamine-hydrolyzing) [Deltaproteobacteria bacterium]|nr:asparagine synthase (glutamine-hydrolyzing) [Deltaproteobacteria bacterium]TLN01162.1 MAG: asparagine synthase (glutamine-hydrolyzing) [bacterium]
MCGIAGFLNYSRRNGSDEMRATACRMSNALIHRGPDDGGVWVDASAGIALGHRRLAIVDLSAEGHQPMHSASGRFVLAYNGEIYNFQEIRAALEPYLASAGVHWRGHSDTEVMLAAFEFWGMEEAVKRFVGMFAFALWDRTERLLHLVRDRLGEKPLYYGRMGKSFLFGSELKALRAHPEWQGEIDRNALALMMRHNCIPAPYSIYRDIKKLPPSTILTIGTEEDTPTPKAYWSTADIVERGVLEPFTGNESEAVDRLDILLRDAIRQQMVADVPLGAFLSGGIDSSTVVGLMQAQSVRPVKTFTIGFSEHAYNEANHAREVADLLGTAHTELYVTPDQALAVIPDLATMYDEPFSDSSQIPTYLVSKLTRNHVTVSLSGDGGDELFAGYNRHFWGNRVWKTICAVPRGPRRIASDFLQEISPQKWDRLYEMVAQFLPSGLRQRLPGDKVHKYAEVLRANNSGEMYQSLVSHWKKPDSLIIGSEEPPTLITAFSKMPQLPELAQRMMYLDLVTYLPDDILVKVDRAGMATSLETRMPFLDHRVVEFAWQVPLSMKIRNGQGKWLLRQVLKRYVPEKMMERPKMGFGVPLDAWLRGPLKDWAHALLDERRLRQEGFFNPELVRQKWEEHLSGKYNWQYHLWDVLMFQAWLERHS